MFDVVDCSRFGVFVGLCVFQILWVFWCLALNLRVLGVLGCFVGSLCVFGVLSIWCFLVFRVVWVCCFAVYGFCGLYSVGFSGVL